MDRKGFIDYASLINESMYYIVREALEKVSEYGLYGDHHFYITYQTNYEGVKMPLSLMKQYPEEITIVIQYNFKDLKVLDEYFQISLSFNGKYVKLVIPFKAISSFSDPSEMFELEFKQELSQNDAFHRQNTLDRDQIIRVEDSTKDMVQSDNVISLEKFRKLKGLLLPSKK